MANSGNSSLSMISAKCKLNVTQQNLVYMVIIDRYASISNIIVKISKFVYLPWIISQNGSQIMGEYNYNVCTLLKMWIQKVFLQSITGWLKIEIRWNWLWHQMAAQSVSAWNLLLNVRNKIIRKCNIWL